MSHLDGNVLVSKNAIQSTGSPSGSSNSSDSSSTGDEERMRRLFKACDEDGDGYLDSNDLENMCRLLGMEECAPEIISQLGADINEKMSWPDFLQCRSKFTIDGGEQEGMYHAEPCIPIVTKTDHWRTSSENSLASLPKPESIDYDSGARDMSPEPVQILAGTMENQGMAYLPDQSTLNDAHSSTTQLNGNRSVGSLKNEVCELHNKLQHVLSEKDILDRQLAKQQSEKFSLVRDFEEKLYDQSLLYEERVTELHSVIAELQRKSDHQQTNVIREEGEDDYVDDNNDSCHSNSAVAGEALGYYSQTNNLAEEVLKPDLNAELSRVVTDLEATIGECRQDMQPFNEDEIETGESDSVEDKAIQAFREIEIMSLNERTLKVDTSQLESQIRQLELENSALRQQIGKQETDLNKSKAQLESLNEEKEYLRKTMTELQAKLITLESSPHNSRVSTPTKRNTTFFTGEISKVGESAPVAKMAGLKKLRTGQSSSESKGLGADISSIGIENAKVAEHLAKDLIDCSDRRELLQDTEITDKMREFEIEIDRLTSKLNHTKSHNEIMQLTQDELKAQCDRITLLLGKYESNNTAISLANEVADQTFDAYESVVEMYEAHKMVLLANFQAAGIGKTSRLYGSSDSCYGSSPWDSQEDVSLVLQNSLTAKRHADHNAQQTLQKIDKKHYMTGSSSSSGIYSPLEDFCQTNSTTSSSESADSDITKTDYLLQSLKSAISQMKADRNKIKGSISQLESFQTDPFELTTPKPPFEAQRLDLENAVLLEELMAMKEEVAEMRAQNYLLQKENQSLHLNLSGKESQEKIYMVRIEHLQSEVEQQNQILTTQSENTYVNVYNTVTPSITLAELRSNDPSQLASDLSESLKRERKLKLQVQELVTTLEKLSKNSEKRHQQSAEFVNDLKKANSSLVTAFDKMKRKYQSRLSKLEKQMDDINRKYKLELQAYHKKLLAQERGAAGAASNETSI